MEQWLCIGPEGYDAGEEDIDGQKSDTGGLWLQGTKASLDH